MRFIKKNLLGYIITGILGALCAIVSQVIQDALTESTIKEEMA
jgi:hypothetical protein